MKVFYCSTCFECYYIHPQELTTVCGCTALFRCVLVYWCGSAGVGWYPSAGWSTTYFMSLIDYRAVTILLHKIHDFFRCGNTELCPYFLCVPYVNLVRILCAHRLNTKLGGSQKRMEPFGERRNRLPCQGKSHGLSSP